MAEQPFVPHLSIIIPAWNEARRLPATLAAIRTFAYQAAGPVEALVIDDGSADATAARVQDFAEKVARDGGLSARLKIELISNEANRGKGFAVRRGMLAATAPQRLLSDADLSTPFSDLPRLQAAIADGADIAIGSRDVPGARLDPPQPLLRRLPAWSFRWLRRRLLLPEIRDTQCGFKLFTAAAARQVFERCTIDGWLFDCEALAIAARLGLKITEIGVTWRNDRDSRVKPLREALRAIPTLLAIRKRVAALSR